MQYVIQRILLFTAFFSFCTILLLLICRDSYNFNGFDHKNDKYLSYALFYRFYFILTTITTVGYGDVSPATIRAKTFVIALIFWILILLLQQIETLNIFTKNSLTTIAHDVNKVYAPIKNAFTKEETKISEKI
jgi:Ion channel